MTPQCIYSDGVAEIWLGDSLDRDCVVQIMGDRIANTLIVDAPYSSKTHSGHKNGKLTADRAAAFAAAHVDDPTPESRYSARKSAAGESGRNDLDYPAFTPKDVARFVDTWHPFCSGWFLSITDDVLAQVWRAELEARDRFAFPGLPLVETGSRCRLGGDGPSPWTVWIMAARPRTRAMASWGTLPGAYIQPAERDINSAGGSDRIVGGKPVKSMCAIVADYSRRGDLVVDPCGGAMTTGIAAKMQGRRFIGIEKDRGRAELGVKRIRGVKEQCALFEETGS